MTQTLTADGKPLYFPASQSLDAQGFIPAPPAKELTRVAEAVASEGLMLFIKRLVDGARKRRFQPRWRRVNRSRLQLAQLCIERALAEQYPDPPDDDREAA